MLSRETCIVSWWVISGCYKNSIRKYTAVQFCQGRLAQSAGELYLVAIGTVSGKLCQEIYCCAVLSRESCTVSWCVICGCYGDSVRKHTAVQCCQGRLAQSAGELYLVAIRTASGNILLYSVVSRETCIVSWWVISGCYRDNVRKYTAVHCCQGRLAESAGELYLVAIGIMLSRETCTVSWWVISGCYRDNVRKYTAVQCCQGRLA